MFVCFIHVVGSVVFVQHLRVIALTRTGSGGAIKVIQEKVVKNCMVSL